ncbi:hypothetical protein B484DRAFT_457857 [Ochromonadaceae sp. CCMP2298]|nr:hypothetical protein B484DRAFT_457857 [Ochromonadaceae sp. CCMP2298]|mmetsp:Transcript_11212/g.24918  ORF Transcript_11212/g.24918 Transcript_11212/m.24918 type:complete len:212 (-) Transcript_11212:235-870(-)|eukprot:CAMPEP_0173199516 /NCGR_PEP_ID=MMETSP1141-20130122/17279_1 /TAXON_ID=483371 /ORGANISM="non described non described, Strain CCMP2298" /LENGTH=211 /DNA_ID=CAMNT_0014124415 /DNA_START=157 /DNA_END=792 /DNA_ORIENTATION=-
MDTDRFNRYAENFTNSSRIVSRCMAQLETASGNIGTVISETIEIEGEISEAEGYLRAMEVELKTISASDKRNAQQKVTESKADLKQMQSSYQSAKFRAEALALKSGSGGKSITSNQKLDNSTATLEQSRNILHQTEQIGDDIINDLEGQKETLQETKEKVTETRQFTMDAKYVLRMMGNRALMHKACVMFTIVILFGAIIGVGYYGIVGVR